ncbi:MAG: transcriptional regulator BetI [Sneathiella sp.]
MPKVGMEDFRRSSLILATLHTIQAKGTIDIRVSDIASHAGVSSGLAHHYFGSKENLILAALRHLLSEFRISVINELSIAKTPREKISAIVSACLNQQQFSQENVTAWLIFYAHAQESPQAQKLLRVYVRRLQSNLRYHLKPMVGDKSASIAEVVGSLIDGIFIRQALRLEKANSDFSKTLIEECLNLHIAAASGLKNGI